MRVAIIGCGQLARMMALAGIPLGIDFSFLVDEGEGADTTCVNGLGQVVFLKPGMNGDALFGALLRPDVVTFEKEQMDAALCDVLRPFCKVWPPAEALRICQSRQLEKAYIQKLGLPTAEFYFVNTLEEAKQAAKTLNHRAVIKSVQLGYDGKNQWRVSSEEDFALFAQRIPEEVLEQGVIVEAFVPFEAEVSLVGVRSQNGEIKFYAPSQNQHDNGILVRSDTPAPILDDRKTALVHQYLETLLTELQYVGVLAMECFVVGEDIVINELAPRVHNSGHWTQQGAPTCQFENHIRAVAGLPLGDTHSLGVCAMVNVLGGEDPIDGAPLEYIGHNSTLHWYGKSYKKGRKLGHVNFVAPSRAELDESINAVFK